MFNGPCQLHGSQFLDEGLPSPTVGYANAPPPRTANPVTGCMAEHCFLNPASDCPDVYMALEGLQFMAEHTRREQYTIRVSPFIAYRLVIMGNVEYRILSTGYLIDLASTKKLELPT